jgi:hypothetical protein
MALQAIEPINKLWVRDVMDQNVVDQQLSGFADEIVIQALLCRRFEKDMLLNLSDPAARGIYRAHWDQAAADLDRAIEGFRAAAVTVSDRAQADAWRNASTQYQAAVLQTLLAIDHGTITEPREANHVLASAKGSIRALTDTAMITARDKDMAAQSSSDAVRSALSGSARLITLFVLIGCLGYAVITRR